jgi:hypothetical protein
MLKYLFQYTALYPGLVLNIGLCFYLEIFVVEGFISYKVSLIWEVRNLYGGWQSSTIYVMEFDIIKHILLHILGKQVQRRKVIDQRRVEKR